MNVPHCTCSSGLRILPGLALAAFGALLPPALAAEPLPGADAESAVRFVKDYVAVFSREESPAKVAEGIISRWDWDAVLVEGFGAPVKDFEPARRQKLREKLSGVFRLMLANRQIVELMKKVKADNFCGTMLGDGRAAVSFVATAEGKTINNLAILRHAGDGWKIVNLVNSTASGKQSFIERLKTAYRSLRDKLTPEELLDQLEEALKRSLGDSPGGTGEAASTELRRLQGTWQATSIESEGKRRGDETVRNTQVVIRDGQITFRTMIDGKAAEHSFHLKVDLGRTPKVMELTGEVELFGGTRTGRTQLAIYSLDGNEFKFCQFVSPKVYRERPAGFKTVEGDRTGLWVFRRVRP